jgi:general transcription factor 3C polypeptide 3 (transcription factor C subunit 4)
LQTACAIATRQYPVVVEQCRKLVNTHQFNNEPLRIMLASLASGFRPTDSFIVSTLQKHLLRELKQNDIAIKSPELLKWTPSNRRYAVIATKGGADTEDPADEDEDILPDENTNPVENPNAPRILTKHNPIPVAVYGQVCTAAKSYQSAICMFFWFNRRYNNTKSLQFIYYIRSTTSQMTPSFA